MPVNILNMFLNLAVANWIDCCIWIMNRPLFNPVCFFDFVLLTVHHNNTAELLKCYGQNFLWQRIFFHIVDESVCIFLCNGVVCSFYKVLTFTKIFDCQLEKQGPHFIVQLLNSNCFLSISIRTTFSAIHFKRCRNSWNYELKAECVTMHSTRQ